jgi:acyl-homoserine lactone synthase
VFECWAAAFELALRHGVTRFVGMIDMQLYPGILNSPIDTRLVGIPRPYAYGVVAGSEIAVSRPAGPGAGGDLPRGPVGYDDR